MNENENNIHGRGSKTRQSGDIKPNHLPFTCMADLIKHYNRQGIDLKSQEVSEAVEKHCKDPLFKRST